jgi:adenosylcobinamide-GDP ribazoletransferase
MQINIDQTHWYDRIWAALIFFTRLPFWRLHQPPKECYQTVVEHWPLAGWITGAAMAATLYFGSWYLPYMVAVILAIVVRLLITGALHEDGLADFLDGFGGGGNNRERILAIMKDSHIGTYGVIGLICYELLLFSALFAMPPALAALTILAADPYAKMVTSQLIIMMPYARNIEESKARTVYRKISEVRLNIIKCIQYILLVQKLHDDFVGATLSYVQKITRSVDNAGSWKENISDFNRGGCSCDSGLFRLSRLQG